MPMYNRKGGMSVPKGRPSQIIDEEIAESDNSDGNPGYSRNNRGKEKEISFE